MRLNRLYNKYIEEEGVKELVSTYNMNLRSVKFIFKKYPIVVIFVQEPTLPALLTEYLIQSEKVLVYSISMLRSQSRTETKL
jgi:hypothetical protein